MTFGNSCMTREALCTKDFTTDGSVFDIGFRTLTIDAGCITTEHPDIVEHGCLFQELAVDRQFLVTVTNMQSTVGNLPTVLE